MPANLDQLTCPGCGYALRGLPDNICPECGAAFDAEAMLADAQRPPSLLHPSPGMSRAAAVLSLIIAIVSVAMTPLIGLHLVQERIDRIGVMCGTHHRGDADAIMFLGVIAVLVATTASAVSHAGKQWPTIARASALATITAWITLFVLAM